MALTGMKGFDLVSEAERLIGFARPLVISDRAKAAIDIWYADANPDMDKVLSDAIQLVRLAWALSSDPTIKEAARKWVDSYYSLKENSHG